MIQIFHLQTQMMKKLVITLLQVVFKASGVKEVAVAELLELLPELEEEQEARLLLIFKKKILPSMIFLIHIILLIIFIVIYYIQVKTDLVNIITTYGFILFGIILVNKM